MFTLDVNKDFSVLQNGGITFKSFADVATGITAADWLQAIGLATSTASS